MKFSRNQVNEMLSIIDLQYTMYIGDHVGADSLSDDDLDLLKAHGIKPDVFEDISTTDRAFQFGRLAKLLGDSRTKEIDYNDFLKYLRSRNYVELSDVEQATLEYVKNQSYQAIKNLGYSIKKDISDIVNDVEARTHRYEEIIRDEALKQVQNRTSYKEMMYEIGRRTGDWDRKLGRIVETEMQNAYQNGRAGVIIAKEGVDALVFKNVYPGACVHCIRLYLTAGIGSKPKVFKLSTLIDNGTNIGVKPDNYKPVIGTVHPYCRCELDVVPTGYKWSEESMAFSVPDKEFKRKTQAHIIAPMKITLGGKEYVV